MQKKLKLAVIGAGPSGSMVSYLLRLQGHEVHLFEKRHQNDTLQKVCGEYLCPAGKTILENANLGHLVSSFGKVSGMKIFSPSGIEVDTCFPENEFGYSLDRSLFDQELISLALKSGVYIHWGFRLQNLELSNGNVTFTSDQKDQSVKEIFDYIIGADGRQSHVAKWMKVKNDDALKANRKVAIHCYLDSSAIRSQEAQGEMHLFDDGSYCGLNPIRGHKWNFSIVCDSTVLKQRTNVYEIIQKKVSESKRLSALFTLPPEEEMIIKVVSPIANHVSTIVSKQHQAFLVGDASGFVDPLTGEGIYHALLTANTLAEVFATTENIEDVFSLYSGKISHQYAQKVRVNYFFQWLIKHPNICNNIAHILRPRKKMRDAFVGLIGNVYSPWKALVCMIAGFFNKNEKESYVIHH